MRYAFVLLVICLVSSLVLGLVYNLVHERIELQAQEEEDRALNIALPQAEEFNKNQIKGISYYKGIAQGELLGYVLKVEGTGYAGPIQMLVGIDKEGVIQGIEILSHQETPGLGSCISEIKPGQSHPWFLEQFEGKDKQQLNFENIQAITGATISSRAVMDAVRDNIDKFLFEIEQWPR